MKKRTTIIISVLITLTAVLALEFSAYTFLKYYKWKPFDGFDAGSVEGVEIFQEYPIENTTLNSAETKLLVEYMKKLNVHISIEKIDNIPEHTGCEHDPQMMFKLTCKDGKTYEIGVIRCNYTLIFNGKCYNVDTDEESTMIDIIGLYDKSKVYPMYG